MIDVFILSLFKTSHFIVISFLCFLIGFAQAQTQPEPYSGSIDHTIGDKDQDDFSITIKVHRSPSSPSPYPNSHSKSIRFLKEPLRTFKLIEEVEGFIADEDERIESQSSQIGSESISAFEMELNYFFSEDPYANWALYLDFAIEKIEPLIRTLFNSSILVDSQRANWEDEMKGSWIRGEVDDAMNCWDFCRSKGIKGIFPPRRGARIKRHGNNQGPPLNRDEHIRGIRVMVKERWKSRSRYSRRSIAETAMQRFKMLFGDKLLSREFARQANEVFIKCKMRKVKGPCVFPATLYPQKLWPLSLKWSNQKDLSLV